MNESGRDNFLSTVGGGDEILFGTVREAGERCTVQERDIKPGVESPTTLFFSAYIGRQDASRTWEAGLVSPTL